MKISVLTLFPEVFEMYLSQTILQRAIELGKMEYDIMREISTIRWMICLLVEGLEWF